MSNQSYTLEVISHLPQFKNQSLRKHYVDGIETVGAWGDEPFEIRFKNNTYQKVQVKISLDGTDVLTGKPANTEVNKDMWVVNGYGTLNLKAWPETNNGGASFVFTSANNSVAVHTHGDLSCRGIIAAAVFVEGHVEPTPVRVEHHHHCNHHHYPWYYCSTCNPISIYTSGGSFTYGSGGTLSGTTITGIGDYTLGDSSVTVNGIYTNNSADALNASNSISFNSASAQQSKAVLRRERSSKSLESLVAVGAGQHVDQKITYVTGLVKPTFTETVRVRYMWWDDLVSRLKETHGASPHASGFPGDPQQKMSLGTTPRVGSFSRAFPREAAPVFTRV